MSNNAHADSNNFHSRESYFDALKVSANTVQQIIKPTIGPAGAYIDRYGTDATTNTPSMDGYNTVIALETARLLGRKTMGIFIYICLLLAVDIL